MKIVNNGFASKEYFLNLFEEVESGYQELTRFNEVEKLEYKILIDRLKEVNSNRDEFISTEIGDALENVVNFIFEKSSVFTVVQNIRTSSNEIDQLVILNEKGRYFKKQGYLRIEGNYIVSECKNYDSKIGVTWIGKLFSLLSYTDTKVGIMFSYKGLTGSGWNEGVGLTKKLFMLKERTEDKIYIIDFNIKHYERILGGESFLKILEEEMLKLSTDTKISIHIEKHEKEEIFKSYLDEQ